jgi:hypothetical protein
MTRPPQASTTTAAREIAPDVYCLGPRGRTQTDVYFVRSGSAWTLIDAGWAKDGPSIKRAAESQFGADTRPSSDPADPRSPRPRRLGPRVGADLGVSGLHAPRRAANC